MRPIIYTDVSVSVLRVRGLSHTESVAYDLVPEPATGFSSVAEMRRAARQLGQQLANRAGEDPDLCTYRVRYRVLEEL